MQIKLAVFGDSHSVIWEGNLHHERQSRFDGVKAFHLGPALAFNLLDKEGIGPGKWGLQILDFINQSNNLSRSLSVMLCFGEIDIRTQVIKKALQQNLSIEDVVTNIALRLLRFAEYLYDSYKLNVFIWEPLPSGRTRFEPFNPNFPEVGTTLERNYATKIFSEITRTKCSNFQKTGKKIFSFGISDQLMPFYEVDKKFYKDGVHLNLDGLNLAIKEFDNLCSEHGLSVNQLFKKINVVNKSAQLVNISSKALVHTSSSYQNEQATLLNFQKKGFCFHTNADYPNPFVLIDLGHAAFIKKLDIFNRFDGHTERARSLTVMMGNDPMNLETIFSSDGNWGKDGAPIEIEFVKNINSYRYIGLRLLEQEYLHLGQVDVYALQFEI